MPHRDKEQLRSKLSKLIILTDFSRLDIEFLRFSSHRAISSGVGILFVPTCEKICKDFVIN